MLIQLANPPTLRGLAIARDVRALFRERRLDHVPAALALAMLDHTSDIGHVYAVLVDAADLLIAIYERHVLDAEAIRRNHPHMDAETFQQITHNPSALRARELFERIRVWGIADVPTEAIY